jgi:GH25 family lysozyme M1 (1,4-beta-N-acetylmuramidase)
MPELNGLVVPAHFNGVGLHDTPGAEVATWDYDQARVHAQELRAHGVTLYKLFGSDTKAERARACVDNGLVVLMRFWQHQPWGRPPEEWVTSPDQLRPFVDGGCRLFEMGWNEFNLSEEWATPIPNAAAIARTVVDAWEVGLERCAQVPGAIPLFPSNTPGGNVGHRACYRAIVAELEARGLLDTVQHVAIHPRPFNNPPDARWSSTNTMTFDEWQWIWLQFAQRGAHATFWATEHGYSLGDAQNPSYPPIDLARWLDYNWALFRRLQPDRPRAIERELAGVCYWFEAGWGHWGPWGKDALRDSPSPQMPAPSPLWVRMGDQATDLAFARYGAEPAPVPLSERARGIDVSEYQGEIDWDAVRDDGISFAIIRASSGHHVDPAFVTNWERAGNAGILRGSYHYLHADLTGQAALFAETVGDRPLELGYWGDFEDAPLTSEKCGLFLAACDERTGRRTGVYSRANFIDRFGVPPWATGRKLWIADWRDRPNPALPAAWDRWEFWQYRVGDAGSVGGISTRIDLDMYLGTEEQLIARYGEAPSPEPEEEEGVPAIDPNIEPFLSVQLTGTTYKLESVQWQVGEPPNIFVDVLNAAGQRMTGIRVHLWNGGEATAVTEAKPGDPGGCNFVMGGSLGSYGVWVGDDRSASDSVFGMGLGTPQQPAELIHATFVVTFRKGAIPEPEPGPEPEPEPEPQPARVQEIIAEIRSLLDELESLLG